MSGAGWHPGRVAPVQQVFDQLVAGLDYPVFVVTAATSEERSGCLVGFVTQASIAPPRLMVFISKANHTFPVACASDHLVVHFLTEADRDVARLFGEETGDEVDKLAKVVWDPGPGGVPVLRRCRGWVAGRVLQRVDAGDHVGHLLDPVDAAAAGPDGRQLSFQDVRRLDPGHPA